MNQENTSVHMIFWIWIKVMNKIFAIYYIPVFIIITLISALTCVLVYSLTLDPKKANVVAKIWGKAVVLSAFVKVDIVLQNFKLEQKYVVMANHQSAFDIFVLYGFLPLDFTFLSKIEVFKIPIFGLAMKVVGAIAVDRENKAGLVKTVKDMEKYMETNRSLLIFPEGTRSPDGQLLPFKKGGFLLAKKTNSKILPVTIINSNKVLKKGSFFVNPFREVKVIINKPIEVNKRNISNIMDEVREVFETNLRKEQS